ncbi:choice-of-anchor D domain-containing protein [Luteolibacter sp. Populi]|uniref:choice-of-anchor D domain-containing protein n=1 Tax=Luteolibacter sp. Populi TaxID=3230487 RepID=UPI003464ECBD
MPDTLRYSFFAPKTLPQKFEQQGSCVAISGTVAVVGSPSYDIDPVTGFDCGAVKIYETVTGKLLHRLNNPAGSPFGNFGESVAISGPIVVVGSCNPVDDFPAAGCVYVYDLSSEAPTVPLFTLRNPDPAAQDQFGHSVAVDGDRVVVGAWFDDSSAANSGTTYVYDISSGQPELPQFVIPNPTPADDDNFGVSVAISGTRMAVAAYRDDTGAANAGRVYIFDLQSGTPTVPVRDMGRPSPAADDGFGNALAMAGNLVAVGAEGADSASFNSGSVVVFDLSLPDPTVPRLSLSAPVTHPNDYFGTAVGLSGTRLVVGCYRDDAAAENAGTAFVYDLAGPSPAVPVASPDKPLPAVADYFGNAVAISGTTVLVTAWHDDKGDLESGCTYVYSLASGTPDTSLLALDNPVSGSLDRFGSAVAVDGNLIVIGSPGSDAGASGAGRVSVHDLSASKPTSVLASLEDPAPDMDENFGAAVAISGTIVVVGGPGDDDGAEDTGRVYVYDIANLPDTSPIRVLRNPAPAAGDRFGTCVAISGNFVVVGADSDDAGATDSGTVYIFNLASPTPWLPVHTLANPSPVASDHFGGSVSISGSRVVVGAVKDDSGAGDAGIAYVYDLAGGTPATPLHVLPNPAPVADDGFGNSVGISGSTVAIGASGKDTGAVNAGVVYVFDLAGPTPTIPWQTLPNPDPLLEDRFGCSVAVSEPRVVVGCYLDNNPTDSGRAYSFNMTSPTPTLPSATQKKSTSTGGDQFGTSVAVSGLTVLVGCPSDNRTAPDKGAAYVFGPAAPEIAIEVSGQEVLSGGAASFGPVAMGAGGGGSISIDILNTGITNLSISSISVIGGNAADFIVSTSGMTSTVPADDDTRFTVTLNPSAPGVRTTTLRIQNSDSDEALFQIVLSGQSLSPTEDTDGDGVNDVSELRMAALGFDWESPDSELVTAFQSYSNGGGLFEPGRVQALRMTAPALTRNPATGQAKLVLSLLKSADFQNYQPLPFTGPQTTITPAGELEFHFSVPDDAAFYRLETK